MRRIQITSVIQPYYSSLSKYGLVELYYKITNTGDFKIDYYEVYFQVTCADGSKFTEWTNGMNVPIGGELTDMTYINTADKKYTSVVVSTYELTTY